MLAVVGYLVPEVFKFPGELAPGLAFADIPNGAAAIGVVPSLGWLQIIASIGYWELIGWDERTGPDSLGFGDFGFGAAQLPKTDAGKKEIRTKELQNGRLAMLGIMELLTHDLDSTKPVGESLFTLHHL
jgi:hypothetical protein